MVTPECFDRHAYVYLGFKRYSGLLFNRIAKSVGLKEKPVDEYYSELLDVPSFMRKKSLVQYIKKTNKIVATRFATLDKIDVMETSDCFYTYLTLDGIHMQVLLEALSEVMEVPFDSKFEPRIYLGRSVVRPEQAFLMQAQDRINKIKSETKIKFFIHEPHIYEVQAV